MADLSQKINQGANNAPVQNRKRPTAPSNKTSTIYYVSQGSGGSIGGKSTLVFILMVTLLIVLFWSNLVKPLADLSFNTGSKNNITKLPWPVFAGGGAVIIVMTMIANSSDDMANFMIVVAVGLLVVYLVEQGGGQFTNLFGYFTNAPKQSTSTASSQGAGGGATVR